MTHIDIKPGTQVGLKSEFVRARPATWLVDRFQGHTVTVEDVFDSHPERALRNPDELAMGGGRMARLRNDVGAVWYTNVANLQTLVPTPLHFSVQEMLALSTVPTRGDAAKLSEEGQDLAVKRPDVASFFATPVKVLDVVPIDPDSTFSTFACLQNEQGQLRELPVDYLVRG
ncbi:MAG: hypothetical protein ACYCW6_12665 [Candidatus Xenobia bacterium]